LTTSSSTRAEEGGAKRPALPRVHAQILSQQILEALRKMILEGDLPPGHRLIEMDLAEQMGASRAPVREAIRRLEQDGLVEIFPNRGAVVVGVAEEELAALYETRAAIEAQAFARAADRLTPEQLEELRTIVARMGELVAAGATEDLVETDVAFHRLVVEASGYAVLRRIWGSLDSIVRVRTMQALERNAPSSRRFMEDTVRAHSDLVDALADGPPERAAQLVHDHITAVHERLLEDAASDS
jgi:DNA-binding GntR family transcriptional regulator